nr:protein phosphatase 1 regulatory subunit 26 [Pogona vitticeps]
MFLVNPSPLVALPRKWEPFPHSRSCRYPICFSESEDDLARTSVSAKVQMIINNLQSEEASRSSSNHAYGRLLQKKTKGGKGRGPKPRGGVKTLQGRLKYTRQNCPADSDGMEVEENSEYAPLSLISDSDDSVDRDIEEAIQEYLKSKGQSVPPLGSHAKREVGEKQAQQRHPPHDPVCSVFRATVETAGILQQQQASEHSEDDGTKWAPSPSSVSSDDSFEQSIKAEIEQFLSEKKQQGRRRDVTAGNKRFDRKETQGKPTVRRQKGKTRGGSQSSLRGGRKLLCAEQHPEPQGTRVSKCLKSKSSDELADFKTRSRARFKTSLAGRSLEQSEVGEKRQTPWKARGRQRLESKNPSDSSSDDGIEEAIQLYQLEKVRKAAVAQRECLSFQNGEYQPSLVEDRTASLAVPSVKSALPEIRRKTLRRKRRPVLSKPAELNRRTLICHELQKGTSCTPPENNRDKRAVLLHTYCRADTAAELMCAEAILDISKTILPPPARSESRSFATEPVFCPQNGPATLPESDSNAVDSDDSIEQEIQAFLAVKAQTERLVAKSKEASHSGHSPPSSSQPDKQARSAKRPWPKPMKLSPSGKRRCKEDSKMSVPRPAGPWIQPETDGGSMDDINSKYSAAEQGKEGDAAGVAPRQEDALVPISPRDAANPFSWGLFSSRNLVKKTTPNPLKYRAGDKSSSLDSDEDLDSAIKDLLRSKRKQKKKAKDPRTQCKKKVRFGGTETMHVLEEKEKACRPKTPPLLKSCLVGCRREMNEEDAEETPESTAEGKLKDAKTVHVAYYGFKEEDDQMKPFSGPDTKDFSKYPQSPWTAGSLTDDSSSVDSDDSIEQEIQRFLAEKAKDSTCSMETPGPNAVAETLETDKPQNSLPKAKCQGSSLSKQRRKVNKRCQPFIGLRGSQRSGKKTGGSASLDGAQTVTYAGDTWSHATVTLEARQGLGLAQDVGSPLQRTVVEGKVICGGKPGQRDLPPKEKAAGPTLQSCFKSLCPLKRKPTMCEFKISSKFIAGLRSTRSKKKAMLWGKRQSTDSALLKRQSGVAASDRCRESYEKAVKRGTRSSGSEAGAEEAGFSPRCGAEGSHTSVSERNVKMQVTALCNEMVDLAKLWPLGVEGPCSWGNASHGSPSEEPPADVGRVSISTGLSPVEIPSKEETGRVQEPLTSGREGKVPNCICDSSPREKSGLDQGRAAEEPTLKALEGGSAEFTDRVVEEYARCLVKSKASNLSFPHGD